MIFNKEKIESICYHDIRKLWEQSLESFPDFLSPVSESKRSHNEAFLSSEIKTFQKLLKSYQNPFMPKSIWQRKWNKMMHTMLYQNPVLEISSTFSSDTLNDMQREFCHFFQTASSFDETMELEEIGQAARNYLVYDVFTEIHELSHTMTPAIFGYSMLYPYSDNYIDDPKLSYETKASYNQMIAKRIMGEPIETNDLHWKKTCELLDDVTEFYEGEEKEDIRNGLLLMLDAQQLSLSQTKNTDTPFLSPEEIYKISSYKGGISVLLDRFYVPQTITNQDFLFYLAYGFFLQLADDLQDITEDKNTMRQTLFTYISFASVSKENELEHNQKMLNKIMHYLHNIMSSYPIWNPVLKEFIETNCYLLLMFSALLLSNENFSEDYLKQFEPYLPISVSFVEKMQKSLEPLMQNSVLKSVIADGMQFFDK